MSVTPVMNSVNNQSVKTKACNRSKTLAVYTADIKVSSVVFLENADYRLELFIITKLISKKIFRTLRNNQKRFVRTFQAVYYFSYSPVSAYCYY